MITVAFTVECPTCGVAIYATAPVGKVNVERLTCGSCGSDLKITAEFPAPTTLPEASLFNDSSL